jgi:hypothetical protein
LPGSAGDGMADAALPLLPPCTRRAAAPRRDFYNLELTDTNKADFTVCHLQAPVAFVG